MGTGRVLKSPKYERGREGDILGHDYIVGEFIRNAILRYYIGCIYCEEMRGHHYYYIPAKIMMSERKEQKPVNDKAIIPMTIHQIQNQLKDDSQFQGQNFHTISIVGRLESFRREPRSNMLLFNDGTGNIEGQINIQDGKMPPYAEGIPLEGSKQGFRLSLKKIWIILRRVLKWKAYTPFLSACLSKNNKKVRVQSSEWFLTNDVVFFQDKVIWSDEKF